MNVLTNFLDDQDYSVHMKSFRTPLFYVCWARYRHNVSTHNRTRFYQAGD